MMPDHVFEWLEFLQVSIRQLGQELDVDIVIDEIRGILTKT